MINNYEPQYQTTSTEQQAPDLGQVNTNLVPSTSVRLNNALNYYNITTRIVKYILTQQIWETLKDNRKSQNRKSKIKCYTRLNALESTVIFLTQHRYFLVQKMCINLVSQLVNIFLVRTGANNVIILTKMCSPYSIRKHRR